MFGAPHESGQASAPNRVPELAVLAALIVAPAPALVVLRQRDVSASRT